MQLGWVNTTNQAATGVSSVEHAFTVTAGGEGEHPGRSRRHGRGVHGRAAVRTPSTAASFGKFSSGAATREHHARTMPMGHRTFQLEN